MGGRDGFEEFVRTTEPRLRTALVLAYGPDMGRDAAAEALAWAWEHWDQVVVLTSPVPYLFKVGQSRTRRIRRRTPLTAVRSEPKREAPWVEPALEAGLKRLSPQQRTAAVLVHCYGWTLSEVAELLAISKSSVQTHVDRGLQHLREALAVERDG